MKMLPLLLLAASISPKPVATSTIPVDLQLDWMKARAELAEAKLLVVDRSRIYDEVTNKIGKICTATINTSTGRPECLKK